MFSTKMALPAHLLQQLPAGVSCGLEGSDARSADAATARARALPLGLAEVDACLPDQGLLRGAVVELAVAGRASLATSLALAACRAAQQEGQLLGGNMPWCAFIDPTSTLYAPGVMKSGVSLERLLVVRPLPEALGRVALRITESRAFAVVVIDTVGVPGAVVTGPARAAEAARGATESEGLSLGPWARIVRRLSLAVEGSETCVLLITDSSAPRPLSLPVAMRIELSRPAEARLSVRIAKDQRGRLSPPRSIAWVRPKPGSAPQPEEAAAWGER